MNLTKPNYQAWLVNEDDYPKNGSLREQVVFLLRYAILAPSAHNTQPWQFRLTNLTIEVFIDKSRALKESDREQRQTYESIGTCLTNLCVAGKHFGFLPAVEYVVSSAFEDENKKLVAKVVLSPNAAAPLADDPFNYITKRHSAKLEYKNQSVSNEALAKLQKLNNFPELQLHFYNTKEDVQKAAEAVVLGTEKAFSNKTFCVELSYWLRHNWTKEPDGMPGFTVGMPGIISVIAPLLIKHLNTVQMQVKMAKQAMAYTPAFGVICGSNEKLNWIKAGELYEKVALAALPNGLNTSPMGAPIEINEAVELLKAHLGLAERPLLFFRVGEQEKGLLAAPRCSLMSTIITV